MLRQEVTAAAYIYIYIYMYVCVCMVDTEKGEGAALKAERGLKYEEMKKMENRIEMNNEMIEL